MLQIHADHAAGTVFGQRFSRHAGDAGAQGEQLLGRKLRGADAAQRHDILRGVEVQPQLGTLAVKGGAVGQQTAVQLQKQPVAVAVHAHGGGSRRSFSTAARALSSAAVRLSAVRSILTR